MPPVIDKENNPISVIINPMPSFVKFQDNAFLIAPTSPNTDLGMFRISGSLSDSRLSTAFDFTIYAYVNPPTFSESLINQRVFLNTEVKY
jgi:hypothetical protein